MLLTMRAGKLELVHKGVIGGGFIIGGSGEIVQLFFLWVVLAMTGALAYLAFFCWSFSLFSHMHSPQTQDLSTAEVQNLIANPRGATSNLP